MSRFAGKTVLFMAGGTGGHVYPALTVADALAAEGAIIHWLGNADGFEGRVVPQYGYELHDIQVRGLRGNGAAGWLKAPWMVSRAVSRASGVIKAIRPDVVIGMGGFAAGPGGVAAKLRGIPLIIHEQNAVMGLTNKLLARIANSVLLADVRASKALGSKEYKVVGNPVRAQIIDSRQQPARYQTRDGQIRLLVLGGSQGAKAVNEAVPQALALLDAEERPAVRHQVGPRWVDVVNSAYHDAGVVGEVVPFIDDMAGALADCDWVVCRSGALTVAELATVGVPAVCIPLPQAVDDHQTANAQTLVDAGAAEILPQSQLNAQTLAEAIRKRRDRAALRIQAEAALSCAKPNATQDIIHTVEPYLS
ncbi:undecaprenyldiphospho-muramoylpentapeptide beta-N-acetylglucosaminyltransferase [Cardiobacteriaceae bacterium TAE3-ERU3]|nr:undecaprenyldiphospho-muramoylpentapeptide beta-N-acetylglucosaminyltransferase [Cardiobacteriaceae bacterium TAE3-ERU3]